MGKCNGIILIKSLEKIDDSVVANYLNSVYTQKKLRSLGKIFEVLGRFAEVLINNVAYGELITTYVGSFTAPAITGPAHK